jgi:hypothetical protein
MKLIFWMIFVYKLPEYPHIEDGDLASCLIVFILQNSTTLDHSRCD